MSLYATPAARGPMFMGGTRAQRAASAEEIPGWQLTTAKVGLTPFGLDGPSLPELPGTTWAGHTVPQGEVIHRKKLTSWYDLSFGFITIRQCLIQPAPGEVGMGTTALTTWNGSRPLQGPIVIEDCEYDGSLLTTQEQAFVGFFQGVASMYRTYVHNSGSGIGFQGTYEVTGSDVTVKNTYVDNLIAFGDPNGSGNHQSAFTVRDLDATVNPNRKITVEGNYFNCSGANASAGFYIQPNDANVINVTGRRNFIGGNGYNVMLEDDQGRFPGVSYHNMRFIDNRMNPTEFGAAIVRGTGEGWTEWGSNYLYSATGPDGRGSVVTQP